MVVRPVAKVFFPAVLGKKRLHGVGVKISKRLEFAAGKNKLHPAHRQPNVFQRISFPFKARLKGTGLLVPGVRLWLSQELVKFCFVGKSNLDSLHRRCDLGSLRLRNALVGTAFSRTPLAFVIEKLDVVRGALLFAVPTEFANRCHIGCAMECLPFW